ncbi:hypothetical protein [Singulisphaera sp. PoT]|uniref:hypothetical protein n=1 Tax=Singulisphaera sp. PoT TaxID=3411797 RepID=UPI003BF58DA0
MSNDTDNGSIDLIRWTFSVNPEQAEPIETYLADLGLDVVQQDEARFVVSWEEPDREVDEVIEAIWALNGEPFEVTQEEFHRLGLHTLQHEDGPASEAA